MYYHEFVELNQDLFIELAKELANNKVFIEYSLDTNYKPSHIPYVRGGSFIEGSGFYLRSSNYMDFTPEQIQSIETSIKSQSQALSAISGQVQSLQRNVGDAGGLRRDIENLAKLQRERQAAEAHQLAQATKPKVTPPPQAERPKDRMVRYPRADIETTPTPGAGVLSTQ